jgi:CDP-diacylglycerol---glycerol-3-phosphate 3-phosphatidyltransferase
MTPWFTWANLVTSLRLALIPATALAMLNADWLLATTVFTIVVISDVVDGKLARAFDQASPLGGLLDHATDATYVSISTWVLAELGLINPWLAPLIALAFIQYTLDSQVLAGRALRASQIGRINGIAYFFLVGTAIGTHALNWSFLALPIQLLAWVLVITSLISMGDRLRALITSSA